MKAVYILLLLLVAVLALGCVGQKDKPGSTVSPASTPQSPGISDTGSDVDDEFGLESDIAEMDSMFNESMVDVSLDDGAFT